MSARRGMDQVVDDVARACDGESIRWRDEALRCCRPARARPRAAPAPDRSKCRQTTPSRCKTDAASCSYASRPSRCTTLYTSPGARARASERYASTTSSTCRKSRTVSPLPISQLSARAAAAPAPARTSPGSRKLRRLPDAGVIEAPRADDAQRPRSDTPAARRSPAPPSRPRTASADAAPPPRPAASRRLVPSVLLRRADHEHHRIGRTRARRRSAARRGADRADGVHLVRARRIAHRRRARG